jgi:hypothetical protein
MEIVVLMRFRIQVAAVAAVEQVQLVTVVAARLVL